MQMKRQRAIMTTITARCLICWLPIGCFSYDYKSSLWVSAFCYSLFACSPGLGLRLIPWTIRSPCKARKRCFKSRRFWGQNQYPDSGEWLLLKLSFRRFCVLRVSPKRRLLFRRDLRRYLDHVLLLSRQVPILGFCTASRFATPFICRGRRAP